MKILLVVSYIAGGGAEHVARKNLEGLIHLKEFEPALLTCNGQQLKPYPVPIYFAEDFRKETKVLRKMKKSLFNGTNYTITKECLYDFKPQLIHLHDFLAFSPDLLRAIYEYKKESGCKVIITHHTYSYICTNDSLFNYSNNVLCEECIGSYDKTIIKKNCADSYIVSIAKYMQKKRIKKYLHNLADLHISPSEFLKKMLIKAFPGINVCKVYNPCIENAKGKTGEPTKNQIVFFGRISREKNIINFTKAFIKANMPYNLLIIGSGPREKELKACIKSNHSKNVKFLNEFLSTEQLHKAIEGSKFFVLPSIWYENSPVSFIEAIELNMVPLVSNIGGMLELKELFDIGIAFDPNKFEDFLEILKHSPHLYEEEKEKLEKSKEKLKDFEVFKYHQLISKIYHEILNTGF